MNVITARKRSCGQVMFLQVSVILPTGEGGAWSRGGFLLPGGGCLVETSGTATAAGGTHPTGMHSCLLN